MIALVVLYWQDSLATHLCLGRRRSLEEFPVTAQIFFDVTSSRCDMPGVTSDGTAAQATSPGDALSDLQTLVQLSKAKEGQWGNGSSPGHEICGRLATARHRLSGVGACRLRSLYGLCSMKMTGRTHKARTRDCRSGAAGDQLHHHYFRLRRNAPWPKPGACAGVPGLRGGCS